MEEITDTCIIENNNQEIKYLNAGFLNASARFSKRKSYTDLGKDFFNIDYKELSLVELFEIDESLNSILNKSTKYSYLNKEIKVDKAIFENLKSKINKIPHLYPTPKEWECMFLGNSIDLEYEFVDDINKLLVLSFEKGGNKYIFYTSVFDCSGEYYGREFYGEEFLNLKELIMEEFEVDMLEIDESEIYIYPFDNSDDIFFFATDKQINKILDYYTNKFSLLKDLFLELMPEPKQSINNNIYLSQ